MPNAYGYLDAADETHALGRYACLKAIIVGTAAASAVVTVYNGTGTTGDVVATIDASARDSYYFQSLRLPDGLFVKLTGGNAKVTVVAS